MSKSYKVTIDIPVYNGWDVTAWDFKESMGLAVEQYRDLLINAKEMSDKNKKLEATLKDMKATLEFYQQWCRDDLHCDLICSEPTDKRAREVLYKHKDVL